VIMLSLDNAASGTNLTQATHVILLEPVAGTKSQATATETQAIGRAHRVGQTKQVTVVRFIMRNTIEQEMHERE
jgi:SNF2 family DNA or RNA helicase